eukprot:GILK01016134.1.p1 GENE.GILK01016134.1~~GILK01016134.1.p1  ORF type:complete len:209 (+),score=23.78 GILK01016134.1:140-766(+)
MLLSNWQDLGEIYTEISTLIASAFGQSTRPASRLMELRIPRVETKPTYTSRPVASPSSSRSFLASGVHSSSPAAALSSAAAVPASSSVSYAESTPHIPVTSTSTSSSTASSSDSYSPFSTSSRSFVASSSLPASPCLPPPSPSTSCAPSTAQPNNRAGLSSSSRSLQSIQDDGVRVQYRLLPLKNQQTRQVTRIALVVHSVCYPSSIS